jgi:predicted dehydrogenase
LVGVADSRAEQAEAVAARCGTRSYTDYRSLLSQIDAAVLAVPTRFHHTVALECIARGLPLLIEKPLASTLEQAEELVERAQAAGVLLQVGHIERFNPAYEELCRRPLQPKLVHCRRLTPFAGRSLDIGVVLDLMIHDIDLVLALVRAPVRQVSALGLSLLGGHEDLAQAEITFANGCVARLTACRVYTQPVRQAEVWAPEGYAGVDYHRRTVKLLQPSARLRRFRAAPSFDEAAVAGLRAGLHTEYLEATEIDCNSAGPDQLTRELQEFVASVQTGAPVRVTGEQGRDALALAGRILDAIAAHSWDGADGPCGPRHLPPALGPLFPSHDQSAAA